VSVTNIWTNGPEPDAVALERAREIGYRDPVVARTVVVQGSRTVLVGVIVAEGEEEAESHRAARRRSRALRQKRGNGNGD
jgi:hypothetical protein